MSYEELAKRWARVVTSENLSVEIGDAEDVTKLRDRDEKTRQKDPTKTNYRRR